MEFNHRTIIRANSQQEVLKLRATTFINNLEPEEGREFEVVVKLYKNKRSLEQNAYYWGVIIDYMSKELGYHRDEAHETLRCQLLPVIGSYTRPAFKDEFGTHWPEEHLPIYQSTTKLNTKEMGDYIDQCIILLASMGVIVPNPEYRGVANG